MIEMFYKWVQEQLDLRVCFAEDATKKDVLSFARTKFLFAALCFLIAVIVPMGSVLWFVENPRGFFYLLIGINWIWSIVVCVYGLLASIAIINFMLVHTDSNRPKTFDELERADFSTKKFMFFLLIMLLNFALWIFISWQISKVNIYYMEDLLEKHWNIHQDEDN